MIKKIKELIVVGVIALCAVSTSGCALLVIGAAAGAASAVYVKGDLEKNFDGDLKKVHNATLAGLKAQNIFVTQDNLTVREGSILGEFSDGEKVNVSITALTEKSSKVKVRVGVFGNELKSNTIMNAIEKKL